MSIAQTALLAISAVVAAYISARVTDSWTAIGLALLSSLVIPVIWFWYLVFGTSPRMAEEYVTWNIFVVVGACLITVPTALFTVLLVLFLEFGSRKRKEAFQGPR